MAVSAAASRSDATTCAGRFISGTGLAQHLESAPRIDFTRTVERAQTLCYTPWPMAKKLNTINGVSISKIELEQNGDVHVEFDLPTPSHSVNYRTDVLGRRSFDVYEDTELMLAARKLFKLLRARMQSPEAYRVGIDCMKCTESSCCREYEVFVEPFDLTRLAAHLKVSEAEVVKKYLEEEPDWTGDYPYRLKKNEDQAGEKCVFLKRDKRSGHMRCSVYEGRPNLCRSFDAADCTLFSDK